MSWRAALTWLLLVASAVTGWSVWRQRGDEPVSTTSSTRPTYLLRDFELIALDGLGKESFVVRAPQLSQDPNDKTMAIQTPLFLLPDKAGQRWTVRSKTGWVAADNSEVRLRGNVIADSPPSAARRTTMKTEQLNVFPDTNKASSKALVTVTDPGSTMRGTGMRADLTTQRIELLSKVNTRYDPKRR